MVRTGFIGAGTVGTALAKRLAEKGYPVVAVFDQIPSSAQNLAGMIESCKICSQAQEVADMVELAFITTPDEGISSVASDVDWHPGQNVVHCSGAASLDILQPAREKGAQVGGFHPLQTFASVPYAIENLPGSTFALEAEEPLLDLLKNMASALEGNWIELKARDKVLYHIGAVFASNYFVTLIKLTSDLWQHFGLSSSEATKALLPLLKGTINNVNSVGLPYCLSGPIARGDVRTIRTHLEALSKTAPELLSLYKELGRQTIPIALAKGGISEQKAKELGKLLET